VKSSNPNCAKNKERSMTDTLMKVSVLPNPIRLHELVALEEGFFKDEGLDTDVQWKEFHDLMGVWGEFSGTDSVNTGPAAVRAAQKSTTDEIASACQWGTINTAGSWNGRWFRDAYAVSRHAIFVRPDSPIQRPEDLADVEIGVGWLAGSHFNVYYRLDGILPLEQIKPIPVGGYGRRLQALLNGEVEAASLLDPQIYMDELGLRRIVGGEFDCLFWVDELIDSEVLRRFFRALDKAEKALQADPDSFLSLWEKCIPQEFKDQPWDVGSWGQGTRFVLEQYTDDKFEKTLGQIERWGLDGYMKKKDIAATTRSCF
jgi:NitT/TauT family transport system substrate-binding protein